MMIVYNVDPKGQLDANGKIKDMEPVLAEIATSLRLLQDALTQHGTSLNTPAIIKYREDLAQMVAAATRLSYIIHDNSQRLAKVSSEVSKQLAEYDDQIHASLMDKDVSATSKAGKPIIGDHLSQGQSKNNIFSSIK